MSAIPSSSLPVASPWRVALPAFLALVLAILVLYRDTVAVMVGIWWRSDTFAHCLLVVPISLWLVWRQRQQLAALTPRAQPWVLLPLLAVAVVWMLADLVVVNAAAQFALVAMLVLAVPAVLGFEVTRAILFPLLFLFFGVPFGEFALPVLMEWTADFTVSALQLSGVPVFREGQNFVIPSGNWSVIDECSGVRYLMASFMVGSLFAYLNYRSYKRRVIFMLFSLVVPIVANWVRAYLIVMVAHLSGNRIATGVDHVLYGWVFFGIVIFIMFVIGARWSEPDPAPADNGNDPAAPPRPDAQTAAAGPMRATVLAAAVIVLLPHLVTGLIERAEGLAGPARLELPTRLSDGWSSEGAQIVAWQPKMGSASVEARRAYVGSAGTVGVYLAYSRGQTDERKIVSSQNMLVGMRDPDWSLPVDGLRNVAVGARTISMRTAEILGRAGLGGARRPHLVVWRMYWIDGQFIAGDAVAKVAGVLARLKGRGDEGAAIVLYADGETVDASNATLQAFVHDNLASLGDLLERTRSER